MLPIIADILNLFNGSNLIIIGIIGLLLFGKDMPVMARRAAKEYFRYKRMITEATSDIRREMDSAADQIEAEKRKIEDEVSKSMEEVNRSVDEIKNSANGSSTNGNGSNGSNGSGSESNGNTYPYGDTPPETPRISQPPPKPAANPLALDVPTPSTHRATDPARSAAVSAAQLDKFQKDVPPPSKIPPAI